MRFDSVAMATELITDEGPVESVDDCKAICQARWETCSAFQLRLADKHCVTISESVDMMGDHDTAFECQIA